MKESASQSRAPDWGGEGVVPDNRSALAVGGLSPRRKGRRSGEQDDDKGGAARSPRTGALVGEVRCRIRGTFRAGL